MAQMPVPGCTHPVGRVTNASVLFEGEFQALLKSRLSSVGTGACKPFSFGPWLAAQGAQLIPPMLTVEPWHGMQSKL